MQASARALAGVPAKRGKSEHGPTALAEAEGGPDGGELQSPGLLQTYKEANRGKAIYNNKAALSRLKPQR